MHVTGARVYFLAAPVVLRLSNLCTRNATVNSLETVRIARGFSSLDFAPNSLNYKCASDKEAIYSDREFGWTESTPINNQIARKRTSPSILEDVAPPKIGGLRSESGP